jgi:hypothetical protein
MSFSPSKAGPLPDKLGERLVHPPVEPVPLGVIAFHGQDIELGSLLAADIG